GRARGGPVGGQHGRHGGADARRAGRGGGGADRRGDRHRYPGGGGGAGGAAVPDHLVLAADPARLATVEPVATPQHPVTTRRIPLPFPRRPPKISAPI